MGQGESPARPEPPVIDLTGETPPEGLTVPFLDLLGDPPPEGPPPPTETVPWSPGPQREKKRGALALILAGLLVLVVVAAFVTIWSRWSISPSDDLHQLLVLIFAPLVGLVGAVTGFYYGSADSHRHEHERDSN